MDGRERRPCHSPAQPYLSTSPFVKRITPGLNPPTGTNFRRTGKFPLQDMFIRLPVWEPEGKTAI